MKRILMLAVALMIAVPAFANEYVSGYTKANGTFVSGYYRSSPNRTVTDNYSYKGNSNPYTGSSGSSYYRTSPSSSYYSPTSSKSCFIMLP